MVAGETASSETASSETASSKLKVFVSYARSDLAVADTIVAALETEDFEVLIDRRDLPYGEEWQKELEDFIRASDTVLWLVSPASVKSDWCNWELGIVGQLNKRLIPLLIREMPPESLPKAIGKIHLLPADGCFSLEEHLPALVETLNTDRAWIKEGTRLADRATQWLSKQKNSALLLRGQALREAEAWNRRRPAAAPAPSHGSLELLLASRQASTRRQLSWTVGTAAAIVLTLLGSFFWYEERQRRGEEERRAAAGEARRLAEVSAREVENGNSLNAALVALEAFDVADRAGVERDAPEVGQHLYGAFHAGPGSWLLGGHGIGHTAYRLSPDGDALATGGEDGTVRIWDIKTGGQTAIFPDHFGQVNEIVFSPDGKTLVSASDDGSTIVRRYPQGDVIARVTGHGSPVGKVFFAPDGSRFATVGKRTARGNVTGELRSDSGQENAIFWDAENGAQLFSIQPMAPAMEGRTPTTNSSVQDVRFLDSGDIYVLHGSATGSPYTGMRDGRSGVWDGTTGKLKFENHHPRTQDDTGASQSLFREQLMFEQRTYYAPERGLYLHIVDHDAEHLPRLPPRIRKEKDGAVVAEIPELAGRKIGHAITINETSELFALVVRDGDGAELQIRKLEDGALQCAIKDWGKNGFLGTGFDQFGTLLITHLRDPRAIVSFSAETCELAEAVKLVSIPRAATSALPYTVRPDGLVVLNGLISVDVIDQPAGRRAGLVATNPHRRIKHAQFDTKDHLAVFDSEKGLQTWAGTEAGLALAAHKREPEIARPDRTEAGLEGAWLAAHEGRRAVVWDAKTWEVLHDWSPPQGMEISYQRFCGRNARSVCVVTCKTGEDDCGEAPDTLHIVDLATGKTVEPPQDDETWFERFDTLVGNLTIKLEDDGWHLTDVETNERLATYPFGTGMYNAISGDGTTLFLVGANEVKGILVVDTETGETLRTLSGGTDERLSELRANWDGSRLAAMFPGGRFIVLWDVESGEPIRRLSMEGLTIDAFTSGAGGRYVIARDGNDKASIWSFDDGGLIADLSRRGPSRQDVPEPDFSDGLQRQTMALSPSGAFAMTGGRFARQPKVWRLAPSSSDLAERLRAIVPSCLPPGRRLELELPAEPPRWCITGPGQTGETDPSQWQPKWPYDSPAWRAWLEAKDRGEAVAMPSP